MSIRICSGPYAYGSNTDLVWNIYTTLRNLEHNLRCT